MSYTKLTDYAVKDGLPSGNSAKIIRGTEIDADFTAIEEDLALKATTAYADAAAAAAAAPKADINSPALTGTPTAPTAASGTSTTQIATTAFVQTTAFSSALPAQAGNAGKYVTTDGTSASWGALTVVGTGGQTTTGNLTLTASSAAAITVTPATPGLYVTLPDAMTCTKADNLFAVYNAGDYDYGVKDSTGTQLGWVRARTGAMIGLSDSSTAAGVWAYYGLEKTGITASYVNSTLTGMGNTIRRIALDADRTCFLFGGTSCYAIVYDASTQTWGAATLVESSVTVEGAFLGVLSATNQVLVCNANSTLLQAVTLTISGVGITVNGKVNTTAMAGALASLGQLIAVGSSFVVSYGRATTTSAIRAITVSGTTPTIGAESALVTAVATAASLFASGSVVRVLNASSTAIRIDPYAVSGTTLTGGVPASATTTNASFRAFLNGNGNIVCHYINGSHYATIFKLTGTTEAASSVSFGNPPTTLLTQSDYLQVTASKTVFVWGNSSTNASANILTDSSGTASLGTATSFACSSGVPSIAGMFVSGNNAKFLVQGNGVAGMYGVVTYDCSGTSPVLSTFQFEPVQNGVTAPYGQPSASDTYGVRAPKVLVSGDSAFQINGHPSNAFDIRITTNAVSKLNGLFIANTSNSPAAGFPTGVVGGASNESIFCSVGATSQTTGIAIQRVEAAA